MGIGVPIGIVVWGSTLIAPRPGEQPPPPSLEPAPTDAVARDPDGVWVLDPERSWVGYRIEEYLPRLGDHFEVAGRTPAVTGRVVIDGPVLEDALVQADLRELESDIERRDRAIQRRFLESLEHPTARFEVPEPVTLLDVPDPGAPTAVPVPGELTFRDRTQGVQPLLDVRWDGDELRVVTRPCPVPYLQ